MEYLNMAIEILTEMKIKQYFENKGKKKYAKVEQIENFDFCIKLLKIIKKVEEEENEK